MTVHLVGAGPGDPDLITVRGARLLAAADVVVHDHLAAPLLSLVGPRTQLVDVGKRSGAAHVPQDDTNALLVDLGRRHETVVRLKGGDPFVFAHGAEEIDALSRAGVPFEVVPGVSSALGAPASARIPLTVRGLSRSFTVLSGHEDPHAVPAHRWRAIADLDGTVVVLMGATRIGEIAAQLTKAGASPGTPVAAIYAATTPEQEVALSSLEKIATARHISPTTFVIGEVVRRRCSPAPQR
jgi:uroporphyrin-III C-methyltransferase